MQAHCAPPGRKIYKSEMKKQTSAYEELEKIANEALGVIVRPQALGFVLSALDTSLRGLRQRRHISGQELCKAVRDLAAREYGLMVRSEEHTSELQSQSNLV